MKSPNISKARLISAFAAPNVTPIVGVLTALMLAVLVTSPASTTDFLIDASLPPPIDGCGFLEGVNDTVVSIGANGRDIFIDEESVEPGQLGAVALNHARRNNPAFEYRDVYAEAWIFVHADQDIPYGVLMNYLGRLREEGFVHLGLVNTQPTPTALCYSHQTWWPGRVW